MNCAECGRETNPNHRLDYSPKFCCLRHSEIWHSKRYLNNKIYKEIKMR